MSSIVIQSAHKANGGTPVLTGVDLTIRAGSITAILGQSGSGKTTLLRSIAGFDRLDSGSITVGDVVVDGGGRVVHAQRRGIGYVPQDSGLFPHLRVAANIGFGLRRSQRHRIAVLVDMLGLGSLEQRFPHELSGGQRQRVALARALAPEPSVVLLDEPFSSLDAALRTELRDEVARVLRKLGTTAVMVTHDRDEALSMADQIAILDQGRITAVGEPHDLYLNPADEATARFLGTVNVVPVSVAGGQITSVLPLAEPPGLADGDYRILIRPEHLAVDSRPGEHSVEADVLSVSYHGAVSRLQVRVRGSASLCLIADLAGDQRIAAGDRVWIGATRVTTVWSGS